LPRPKGKEVAIAMPDGVDAGLIKSGERDHHLSLVSEDWGPDLENLGWDSHASPDRHFSRKLRIGQELEPVLTEHLVRFPSAPVYGINRKVDYSITFPARPNMHTLRILGRAGDDRPVGRLFLFHNGLNETENLRFYYRLADWILDEDPPPTKSGFRSACLIAPFPGHLMHAPFPGPFAQSPLSRYLSDSGELFRQFLRYMAEMRWLLGAINEMRPQEWLIGDRVPDYENLPKGILTDWEALRTASAAALKKGEDPPHDWDETQTLQKLGLPIDEGEIESMVAVLRRVLELGKPRGRSRLPVHVVGYSLGGFLAQSVFFAWPNMVSSCATICSGGAIRALSPTAFAHPEEWQAVLHTLRPELEESMLRGRIAREGNRIAGMREERFSYYQRIFDQVFLQEDKASYQARLAEYGTRMLFIGGGNDPIVKPKEILDASPAEGITMLSVASLTHFLDREPQTDREIEQRGFWLPEAGGLIGRAARRAGELRGYERREVEEAHAAIAAWGKGTEEGEKVRKAPQPKEPRERDLSSPTFEKALDWVIDGVPRTEGSTSGWLFVCRNVLPAAFLGPEMHRSWATGLHHHDVSVQAYALGLARHAAWLEDIKPRVSLVLPSNLERRFVKVSSEMVDPHSDAPGYQMTADRRQTAWDDFQVEWGDHIRWLDAGPIADALLAGGPGAPYERFAKTFTEGEAEGEKVPADYFQVAHLPDAWISIDALNYFSDRDPIDEGGAIWSFVEWVDMAIRKELIRKSNERQESGETRPATPENSAIREELESGKVRIVRVSGTELNPRYRGRFEQSPSQALQLLAHCAAALVRSASKPKTH
jgi:hypothetical protein